ncbi:exo-alpha-sialidase [Lignipirellula cremea]|uniref:GDSL-like Lipase/Acylhydrolase n=1 Tax=Lignipirellula cremea TaxID=2528010 RepID=A0A518DTY5_9BACT|nr:exo-alpha-sialidase [Lignipirellula cremea]QDU95294.1 GDSL-like Lipase/Acylhydrolase [Lignipirellula cremea]
MHSFQHGLRLAVVLLFVTAAMSVAKEPAQVVVFGDSVTATRGELKIYAHHLAEAFHADVHNAGVGGNTTSDGLVRFHRDVLSRKPDIVIIGFGINDAAVDVWKDPPATEPRVPLFIYEANLRHFVRMCKKQGATPILLTPNPLSWTDKLRERYGKPPYDTTDDHGFNVLLPQYAATVRRVAHEENVGLVDMNLAFEKEGAADLLLDGMHPNEAGQALMSDLMQPLVAQAIEHPAKKPAPPQPFQPGAKSESGIEYAAGVKELDHLNIHGPFVKRPDGALVAVSQGGALETDDFGKSWKTFPIAQGDEKMIVRGERAMLQTASGALVLVYLDDAHKDTIKWGWDKEKNAPVPGTRRDAYVVRSLDGGHSWEKPQRILTGYCGAIRDIVQMKNGRLVVPLQNLLMEEARHATVVYTSDDDGVTWQERETLDVGGRGHHDGSIEATLVELKDGRLWMLLRTNLGYLLETFSDDGVRWSPMHPTAIDASSAPAMVVRLASGRLMLAWNQTYPEGETNFVRSDKLHSQRPASWHRGELSIAFSDDEGHTWTEPVVVARKPKAWLSYPYLSEVEPGRIWVTTMQGGVRLELQEKDFVQEKVEVKEEVKEEVKKEKKPQGKAKDDVKKDAQPKLKEEAKESVKEKK